MIIEYRAKIGKLSFSLTDSVSQEIPGMTAIKTADIIAHNIEKIFRDKYDTDYGLKVELLNIRRGSWLVDFSLSFKFLATSITVSKFINKYNSIREDILLFSKNMGPVEISGRRWFKNHKFVINVNAKVLSLEEKDDVINILRSNE